MHEASKIIKEWRKMEALYIPQLDEVDASGETTATRYKLLTKIPEAGVVGLEDKTVLVGHPTEEAARSAMLKRQCGQMNRVACMR